MSSIPFFSTVYRTRFLGNNRDNDAREGAMPSNTLAAFAAGLFVATLVLTHDASAGDELLVARGLLLPSPLPDVEIHASWNASAPDPNVVEGRASDAPEGTKAPYPDDEATDSTRATDATDATDDRPVAERGAPEVRGGRALEPDESPMTTREAFAAAMATTRLALRLWARAGRPATDALEWYTRAGFREILAYLWRVVQIVKEAPARVKATAVAGFAAFVAARAAALALARHLRRARYRARVREALSYHRRRFKRVRDRAVAPFVAVARRVKTVATSTRARYNTFLRNVKAKSRVAALLAPHVIVFGVGGVVIALMPHWARAFVRKREVVASATLLVPTFFTVNALEKCRATGVDGFGAKSAGGADALRDDRVGARGRIDPSSSLESLENLSRGDKGLEASVEGGRNDTVNAKMANAKMANANALDPERARLAAEAWLRFWSSAAPLMFTLDLPFVATGVHVLVPFWPELTLLWTAWLTFPMTAGARLITEAAAPRVAGWSARANVGVGAFAGAAGISPKGNTSSRGTLRAVSFFFPIRRLRRVLDRSAHRSLRGVQWGLRLAGFRRASTALGLALDNASLPMIGCAVFFFTPTFLTLYGCATAALALPAAASLDALGFKNVAADGGARSTHERSRKICALLRYWLAYSMLWSLARELSRGALSWFPLWRHVELALVFWLAVFGGADEVTARLFAAKASIVSEHHKAAARARVAKEAARLERGSGSRDSLRSAGSQGTIISENESELHETESDGERDGDDDDDEGLGVDERPLPERARVAGSVAAGAIESRGAFENVGVSEETLRRRVNVHKSSAVGGRE